MKIIAQIIMLILMMLIQPGLLISQVKESFVDIDIRRLTERSNFTILKGDSVFFKMKAAFNEQNRILYYYGQLKTPVCEGEKCQLLEIILYWDLLGNYLKYEIPEGKGLTKNEHLSFSPQDYAKLDAILKNNKWSVSYFPINQLIDNQSISDKDIDGYSGATAKFIKAEDNISGALYTVYILWHFIYSPEIRSALIATTAQHADEQLLLEFLSNNDLKVKLWAIRQLKHVKHHNDEITESLMSIIRNSEPGIAYEALHVLDSGTEKVQMQLWENYKMNVIQDAIINKFQSQQINKALISEISTYIQYQSEYLTFKKLLNLLSSQRDLSGDALRKIAAGLDNDNPYIARETYDFLENIEVKDSEVKKMMKRYHKNSS